MEDTYHFSVVTKGKYTFFERTPITASGHCYSRPIFFIYFETLMIHKALVSVPKISF